VGETGRERTLAEAEIKILGNAVPAARLARRSARTAWLILATGVRIGEAMGSVWADPRRTAQEGGVLRSLAEQENVKFGVVDLVARTWHLPDTKNGRRLIASLRFAYQRVQDFARARGMIGSARRRPPSRLITSAGRCGLAVHHHHAAGVRAGPNGSVFRCSHSAAFPFNRGNTASRTDR
jgi:integrase